MDPRALSRLLRLKTRNGFEDDNIHQMWYYIHNDDHQHNLMAAKICPMLLPCHMLLNFRWIDHLLAIDRVNNMLVDK